jgi:hypothetical protein
MQSDQRLENQVILFSSVCTVLLVKIGASLKGCDHHHLV